MEDSRGESSAGREAAFVVPGREIERRGLRDHVYERILTLLLRGDTPPGTRLSIDQIARRLGVSPTPVREAFVHLERTGLVTREALKGYRMAPPLGQEQLAELFTAREMLESTAARLAAARADTVLPMLREAHERHRRAGEAVIAAADDGPADIALLADYFTRDREFHDVIFVCSNNRYLADMSANLDALLHRMKLLVHGGITDVHEAYVEHGVILAAFEQGNAEAIEQAMRAHIGNVRARALRDAPADS